jgi:hypothetical protein
VRRDGCSRHRETSGVRNKHRKGLEANLRAGKEETLTEQEIIELLKKENEEFRKLEEEHKNLKNNLVEIDRKVYLTTEEEVERKKLQKLKLIKKDRMAELIREYKKGRSN